jgi:hypothetical protein
MKPTTVPTSTHPQQVPEDAIHSDSRWNQYGIPSEHVKPNSTTVAQEARLTMAQRYSVVAFDSDEKSPSPGRLLALPLVTTGFVSKPLHVAPRAPDCSGEISSTTTLESFYFSQTTSMVKGRGLVLISSKRVTTGWHREVLARLLGQLGSRRRRLLRCMRHWRRGSNLSYGRV